MSRKTRHKKVWQSVISCVLAFALAFSMTVPAFASPNNEIDEGGETIKYVSIGDSMTNGYGLDKYEEPNDDGTITNWFGFMRNDVKGSYPWKVADHFGWELSQIATSGLRADDVYYLLNLGTDYEVNWDDYGRQYMAEKFEQSYKDAHGGSSAGKEAIIAWAAEQYQAEVKSANVISVGIGSNNFATLMDMRMMWWMGRILGDESMFAGGGYQGKFDFNELVADLTAEEKAEIAAMYDEAYAEIEAILKDSAADAGLSLDETLAADGATLGDFVADMSNAIAYTSAGFALGYKGTLDTIIRENPEAEIIIVGLTNWFRGMVYGLPVNGEMLEFPMGDMMERVCELAGVYMAALPAAYEAEAKANGEELQPIYFADTNAAGVPEVELIVDVIVKNTADVDLKSLDAFELGSDERFEAARAMVQGITATDDIPGGTTRDRLLEAMTGYVLSMMAPLGIAAPTMAQVEAADAAVASYYDPANAAMVESIKEQFNSFPEAVQAEIGSPLTMYLSGCGLENLPGCIAYMGMEKSMISSLHLDVVNAEHFEVLKSLAGPGGLMETTMGALNGHMNGIDEVAGALVAVPELLTVSNLMFNFLVGSGVIVHPSDGGHTTIASVIIDAYEDDYTAGKETDQNLVKLYNFLKSDEISDKMQVELVKKLYSAIEGNASEDEAIALSMIAEIYTYLSDSGKINDEQTMDIVLAIYAALFMEGELEDGVVVKSLTDDEIAAIVELILATLGNANPEASDRIAIIGNVYSILMDYGYLPTDGEVGKMLTTAEALYDALVEAGYLSDDQSFEIVEKLWAFLMENDDRSAEAVAALIDQIYLIVFFEDPDLTPEKRNEIGLIILGVLEEQGYIGEEQVIDLLDPYYQEAVAGVLTAEVVDLIVKGIDATAAAVEAAQAAAAAIADSDLKDALLAELAATLETLDVARYIFAAGDLNDLRGAMAAMLELKGELDKHAATISVLAEEAGIAAEPYIVKALEAAEAYIALADETIAEIYAAAVEACEDFTAAYAAWVEDMAARAAAIDPALGDAVRAFLTEVPADSLAILYAYGDEALTKLVADAAVAYGDIYDIVAALAQVLYADGEAIYNAVLASDDFAAVKAEIEGLLADIAAMIEAAKMAPATTIVGYEEKLAELYDRLFDSYEKLYPIVLDAMDQVDPTLRPMVEKLVDALYEALNVSSAFVGAYGEWLPGHAGAMAGALLNAFLENWGEFAPVAGPIAGELAVELATELGHYLLAELVRALPGIDQALYDWFYNNPDKVCDFFAEYGDDMGAFFADNHEIILGILGYIAMEFGDEAVEYVLANPEECLTALVNWYNTYGDRIWAMIDVYMNYLGVYDAIEAEIAILEAELADLKAELEKAAGEMDAALKAEIEKQIAAIEKQIAALEKALDELEAAILAGKTAVEAQIEALKGIADALKGDVEALIALVEQIGSDAEAMKAATVAICAEIAKLLGSDWADKAFEQILAFLKEASPKVDQALYDWFYNNPDKTVAFFTEYGDEFVEHGDAILAVLGYIAMEFGDDVLEYVIANPEQSLDALVQWYETYGYRIWPMVNVYLEYLGVYDALEAEIAELEAQLVVLKAELEKAADDMDAALKAEIEKQIAEIEKQIAELKAALAELEAAILAFQAGVEDQIEALIAQIEKQIAELKAAVEALEAMAQQLNAEIQAAIAELKAAIEAIEAAVEALIEDASQAAEAIEAFFEQLVELLGELYAAVEAAGEDALADAVHGEYAIDSDASYVALGDATIAAEGSYADQVAAFMANLAGSEGVQSNYEKVAIADDEDLAATVADILAAVESGELDEVLADAGLVTVSAGAEDLTVSIIYQLVDALSAFAMSSINEAESNDWASLVGTEAAAAVEQALAVLEAELAKQLGDETTAALAVESIEAVAFAYANFSVNYVKLLDAVQVAAPNAHVVAVGLANALEGLTIDIDGFELALGEYAGWVVEAADLEMLAYALLDEGGNVTFVSASEADCDAAAVISEVVEAALAIDFENNPEAVLELLPLVAEIVDSATWMPNEAGQAYITEQILGAIDFVAVADAIYTAEAAQPSVAVAVDGVVVTDGYTVSFEAVEVTDEAVAYVTLEDGCVIEATFAIEHLATVDSFEDFGEPADGHWYLEEGQGSFAELRTLYMDYALATGLMSGYVNRDSGTITHFGPWDSLDRAQAATVIYRMANEDASATLDPAKYADNATAMADVEDGEYYTAAVNWCVENEIITGYLAGPNKGKFMPYNKVTRSELAAMIQRYCVNVCDVEMLSADVMGYDDSDLIDTTWALPGLEFCKAYGIMTGIHGTNQLNPVGKANRAEAAKMFSVVGHDVL